MNTMTATTTTDITRKRMMNAVDSAPATLISAPSASPVTGLALGSADGAWPAWPGSTMGLSSTTDPTGTFGCLASSA